MGGGVVSLRSKLITVCSPLKVGQTVMTVLAQHNPDSPCGSICKEISSALCEGEKCFKMSCVL